MDANWFDQALPVLTGSSGRRGAVRALAAAGLALLAALGLADGGEAKKKRKKKKIRLNDFGCVNVGGFCKNSGQCCSGICEGKKGKKQCKAHDTGGCQAEQDFCESIFGSACPDDPLAPLSACFRTTGDAQFCGPTIFACAECAQDADCGTDFGLGAACVVCADCPGEMATACVPAAG